MTPQEKQIREALPKATKGSWIAVGWHVENTRDDLKDICNCWHDGIGSEKKACADATYIAACQPAAIRVLIAELDSLRKDAGRLDWLDSEMDSPLSLFDGRYINLSEKGLRYVIDAAMGDVCK